MKHKTFLWFMLPSGFAMLLFIALPIMSVLVQSLYIEHEKVLIEVENCVPLGGCTKETVVDTEAAARLKAEQPLGQFNGFGTYTNRNHLATAEIAGFWRSTNSWAEFGKQVYGLPFYKALAFTLTYTFLVTPMVIILGFCIALAVNALPRMFKGLAIFFSLLPMMVTPLVGSLILYWMIDSRGVLGQTLQVIMADPDLSLRASPVLTWIMLMVYGTWSSAPFAFVVFYAGLQTVPEDTLESAMIDGASRWERVRYVVIPYLMPLVTFIALIQLMDNFRVFEPIVGFSAEASATSLSWIIYNDLRGEFQLFGSAAATSMLTILGVAVLLTPVLIRTWRDFKGAKS
ncbi:MAG: sugar ABC transporter permease [Litoreibacter sp.]|nr:sugar ABC transporter permease [Litoreibacter sp.]MCY4336949.1 sugar ABC transporter permease [Litoreibacter sp.]